MSINNTDTGNGQGIFDSSSHTRETVTAYKGFNRDWKCRDYQYELGKTFEHEGSVSACNSGFHACENPLDIFSYYWPCDSRFAVVELFGEISRHDSDSKIAGARITIKAEIGVPTIVEKTIAYITALCSSATSRQATGDQSASSATGDQSASSATGDRSASSATGDQSASSATGDQSASSATGDQSASSATGDRSASSATGDQSASSATGDRSASSATGDWSASSATGYRSASSATGDRSASSATGYRSASSATGDQSASSATGDQSASSATGDQSASSATGDWSASSATGKAAVAINVGRFGRARASEGGAIVLCRHDVDGNLLQIFSSRVGDGGIRPDVFYMLNDDGNAVEITASQEAGQ